MSQAHHIFTLGYEGLDISAFIARAQVAGVKTVVDVRDKDPRAQGNDAQQRTAEQQRQIEDIRRRQQQQQQQNK